MITAGLVVAGLCCCGGASLLGLAGPPREQVRLLAYLSLTAAMVLFAVAGIRAVLGVGARSGWAPSSD